MGEKSERYQPQILNFGGWVCSLFLVVPWKGRILADVGLDWDRKQEKFCICPEWDAIDKEILTLQTPSVIISAIDMRKSDDGNK